MDKVSEQNTKNSAAKSRKVYLPILALIIISVGLIVGLNLVGQKQEIRKKAAGTGIVLSISPANTNITSGETFSVGATIDTGDDTVTAAELHLTYDQTKLEAQSISAGSFLPVVLMQGKISTGAASITLGSQPSEPKKGSGILVTLTFKALSPSTSQINFDSSTQVAAVGKTGNAVSSMTGNQVTINSSVSPTSANPTPTTVITPTLSPTLGPSTTPIPSVVPSATPTVATITPTTIPIPTTSSCVVPRPCLFYTTPCVEPTPVQGYCPTPTQIPVTIVISTSPTCIQPPPCVYALPPCLLYPAEGRRWCESPSVIIFPTSSPTIPVSIPACPKKTEGDANCDGKIDGLDYSIWLNSQCHPMGSQTCSDKRADYNQDGNIDDNDYQIWMTHRN